jgi:hypothetical protein
LALSGTLVIVFGTIVALFDGTTRLLALGLLGVALAIVSWLAVVLWREAHFVELLPDWLHTVLAKDQVYEDDGVQWGVQSFGTDLSRGVTTRILLQNNIEAERVVCVRLRDETGPLSRHGRARLSAVEPVRLAPRAQVVVTVSANAADERPIKGLQLFVLVTATGHTAPRNRRLRAEPGPHPTPRWLIVLAPLGGHLITERGGMYLPLCASGGPPTVQGLAVATVETAA